MSNPMLDECAEHLAREHHEQCIRIAGRIGIPALYGTLPWDQLLPGAHEMAVKTMYSLLYRGVILCPLPEHRIKVTLRTPE